MDTGVITFKNIRQFFWENNVLWIRTINTPKSSVYSPWPLESKKYMLIKNLNQSTGNKQLIFICISFSQNIQYLEIPWMFLLENIQSCGIKEGKGGRQMHSELLFYSNYIPWDVRGMSFQKTAMERLISYYKMIIFLFLFIHLCFA